MAEAKIVGYKKIFGLILPDWVNEKMMNLFLGGIFSIFLMLMLSVFYIRPMYDEIKKYEAELETEQDSLENLKQSKTSIDRLKTELSEAEVSKILASVPDTYSPDMAIFILREIANSTGVSIISYSLPSGVLLDNNQVESTAKKKEDMVNFSSYPIKIVVAAPVDILLKFINKVENSLPYGVVSDLNLQEVTKLSKQVENKNVQIAMELRYYQAKLGKVNINNLRTLTDKNIETANLINGYDLITISNRKVATSSVEVATTSADLFGF